MHEYNCHGFHNDLPRGRSSGTISIDESGIEFKIGSITERVSLEGIHIKLGGASERLVFLKHPSLVGWEVYTNDRSILNNPVLRTYTHLFDQLETAKSKRRSNWILLIGILLVIAALPIFAISRMDWLSSQIAKQVPTTWEEKLGRSTIAQLKIGQTFLPSAKITPLLSPLTQPLVSALTNSKYQFHFYIVENATPNAFALPGGFVVIHSGLILKASNAEELLGVLAHELTHVSQQHGVKSVIGSASVYLLISALFGDTSGLLATLSGAAPVLISQNYSRDYEREADKIGFELLKKAHIEPTGLASFFQKMISEEKKRLEVIEDENTRDIVETTFNFLSTHPAMEERIAYLGSLPVSMQASYLNLQTEFIQLQEHVIQLISTIDNQNSDEDLPNED